MLVLILNSKDYFSFLTIEAKYFFQINMLHWCCTHSHLLIGN
ncbi:hypothetical protein CIT292_10046 [Citrobacter youngae ATCC 29220]|uniref:Uncharacterized protein n=1 Tax=Citrobacter youngae ATCC 29220 TaxID=500640 RepID=D4BHN3_9ENTR|nr:hypothetical protein CIT292_10046 [Citrobacter youngae ATCC 29220]